MFLSRIAIIFYQTCNLGIRKVKLIRRAKFTNLSELTNWGCDEEFSHDDSEGNENVTSKVSSSLFKPSLRRGTRLKVSGNLKSPSEQWINRNYMN